MRTTVEHAEIREWAKARGVVPRIRGDLLSFSDGEEVDWQTWFERFDEQGHRFSYDPTATAPRSLVYEIS